MAIALDTTAVSSQGIGVTSITQSATLAGSDSVLVVGVYTISASTATATWNGVSMSQAGASQKDNASGDTYMHLFYLVNPDLGTHDVVASFASSTAQVFVANFNGVKQQAPEATGGTSSGTGTSSTNTLTTISDNALHIAMFSTQANNTASTATQSVVDNSSSAGLWASSPYAVTPAGSNTLTLTHSSAAWGAAGAVFAPVAAAVTSPVKRGFNLLGVGQ